MSRTSKVIVFAMVICSILFSSCAPNTVSATPTSTPSFTPKEGNESIVESHIRIRELHDQLKAIFQIKYGYHEGIWFDNYDKDRYCTDLKNYWYYLPGQPKAEIIDLCGPMTFEEEYAAESWYIEGKDDYGKSKIIIFVKTIPQEIPARNYRQIVSHIPLVSFIKDGKGYRYFIIDLPDEFRVVDDEYRLDWDFVSGELGIENWYLLAAELVDESNGLTKENIDWENSLLYIPPMADK